MLARLAVLRDTSLSDEQRQLRLAELSDHLSGLVETSDQRAVEQAIAEDAQWLSQSDDAGQLQFSRKLNLGPEAAQRLAERDQARAQWQARVARYRMALQPLLVNQPVDPMLLADLRGYHFNGPELVRIAALDKIELGL